MKTKSIPAIVMLAAGFVTCIAGLLTHIESIRFFKILLAVLVIFYIIGCIVKAIIDRNFKEMEEETTDGEAVSEEETDGESEGEEEPEPLDEKKEEK